MKKIIGILIILFVATTLFGCTQGNETNISTGQQTEYKGISYDSTQVTVNGSILNGPVNKGEKVVFLIKGLDGFKVEDELVYPTAFITVTSTSGEELLSKKVFDGSIKGYPPSEVKGALSGSTTIGYSFEEGKEYTIELQITDEKNEENTLTTSAKITIASQEGYMYSKNGLEIKNDFIGVMGSDDAVHPRYPRYDPILTADETVYVFATNLEGLEVDSNGEAIIDASVVLKNNLGEELINSESLYPDGGVFPAENGIVKNAYITLPISDFPAGTYSVEYTYTDLSNNNSATKTRFFVIE